MGSRRRGMASLPLPRLRRIQLTFTRVKGTFVQPAVHVYVTARGATARAGPAMAAVH